MYELLSLNGSDWQLREYLGHYWLLPGNVLWRDHPGDEALWMPATVPGVVQADLIREERIPDPFYALNSPQCEWVHQRDWVYRKSFTVPKEWSGRRIRLRFDGVDYYCHVSLNGELLGTHEGTCLPFEFDVADQIKHGQENRLVVAVHRAPDAHSQIGHTTETRHFKPRFAYGWDFAPRVVPLGIWQDVEVVASGPTVCRDLWVRLSVEDNMGHVNATVKLDGLDAAAVKVDWVIRRNGLEICGGTAEASAEVGETFVHAVIEKPEIWWTNGLGEQPLYEFAAIVRGADGGVSDKCSTTFGFRELEWVRTEGAPEEALCYQPVINGVKVPIRGWNWVPLSNLYGTGIEERYERFIELARRAGVNLLRVWGGGILEKDRFYDLCDRAGILIWQEFQMSSSGVDNEAPSDEAFCKAFAAYAREIIPQRRNHVSLGLWCGGNELNEGFSGPPHGNNYPPIAALKRVVDELDPGRHFLPTSGSGPDSMLRESNWNDVLHDVHGPWTYFGPRRQYEMANTFTAMLHSEFGAPGAAHSKALRSIASEDEILPPSFENPLWRHRGDWWIHEEQVRSLFGDWDSLDDYVRMSQFIQFEGLRCLVESNHRDWPRCAGTMPWQFNEPWACTSCTCSVDHYASPKPAYYGVARAYRPVHVSLRYDHLAPSRFAGWKASALVTLTEPVDTLDGELTWVAMTLEGKEVASGNTAVRLSDTGTHAVADLSDGICMNSPMLLALRLRRPDGALLAANDYLLGGKGTPMFSHVDSSASADVSVRWVGASRVELANNGKAPALWVEFADAGAPGTAPSFYADDSYFCLLPSESRLVRVDGVTVTDQVAVRGWNSGSVNLQPA